MRDYRDAKNMAHTLRNALAEKNCKVTISESLELIARLFGVRDWNTLSALIKNSDLAADSPVARKQTSGLRFAANTEETLHRALAAGSDRGQLEVCVEHLLLALTEDPDATAIIKAAGVDPRVLREELFRSIEVQTASSGGPGGAPVPSHAFQRVVQRAILDAQSSGGSAVTGADLLVAIFSVQGSAAVRVLQEHGIDRTRAVKFVPRRRGG